VRGIFPDTIDCSVGGGILEKRRCPVVGVSREGGRAATRDIWENGATREKSGGRRQEMPKDWQNRPVRAGKEETPPEREKWERGTQGILTAPCTLTDQITNSQVRGFRSYGDYSGKRVLGGEI